MGGAGLLIQFPWMDEAVCKEIGTEAFFPKEADLQTAKKAKAICNTCPVINKCLEHALSFDRTMGIWGGTTERDRWKIKRQRRQGI